MTENIMKLSEITESREVMESKPYPMLIYFIYILLGIIIISLSWMFFTEIDIVVKGTGMVRPNTGISIVNNKLTGKVAETYLKEGLEVVRGDLLFSIVHNDLKATHQLLTTELEQRQIYLSNLELFKKSVLTKENLFNLENPDQADYYYKYLGFAEELIVSKETLAFYKENLSNLTAKVSGMITLKKSIESGTNMISGPNDLYSLRYTEFESKKLELNQLYLDATEQYRAYDILFKNGVISKNDNNTAYTKYLQTKLAYDQYEKSYLSSLTNEIEEIQLQIRQVNSEIKKLAPGAYNSETQHLPIETKYMIDIDNQISTLKKEIRSIEGNLAETELEIEKSFIRAEANGVINLKKEISLGDYISAGDTIATIIPSEDSEFKIQIYMPEKEISTIKFGDSIRYQFHALPYKEYGALTGKVTSISTDSVLNKESGKNYFVLEGDVENKPLYSYKGERAELKVGMMCEAQVITKSKKVLFFLLEKIDMWD
ncbi:MAG: HlyD family efflux transporter periplasmic adaptor subunit [Alkaliphilus sp.]|nr:HlyD family efflux transporter periplasmic adaptor subunit [Alkaliphilus sp.]